MVREGSSYRILKDVTYITETANPPIFVLRPMDHFVFPASGAATNIEPINTHHLRVSESVLMCDVTLTKSVLMCDVTLTKSVLMCDVILTRSVLMWDVTLTKSVLMCDVTLTKSVLM